MTALEFYRRTARPSTCRTSSQPAVADFRRPTSGCSSGTRAIAVGAHRRCPVGDGRRRPLRGRGRRPVGRTHPRRRLPQGVGRHRAGRRGRRRAIATARGSTTSSAPSGRRATRPRVRHGLDARACGARRTPGSARSAPHRGAAPLSDHRLHDEGTAGGGVALGFSGALRGIVKRAVALRRRRAGARDGRAHRRPRRRRRRRRVALPPARRLRHSRRARGARS